VFWAAVLAVLFRPLFHWVRGRLRGREVPAAALTVVVILLVVVLPLTLVAAAVGREAALLYTRVSTGEIDVQAPITAVQRAVPRATELLGHVGVDVERLRQSVSGAAMTASRLLASRALAIGQDVLRIGLLAFVMVYLLFFFIKDGDRLMGVISRALPLPAARQERLFARFAEVSRATIKGTLIIGAIQGTLGGLMFALLGIRGAVFWGVVMTILSILPAVGAGLVWAPAAVILLVGGEVGKGVALIAVGALFIGLIDNVLRPVLVGRDARLPDYIVLVATLGGLATMGLGGFVIGPIIAALFLTVWQMFIEQYEEPGPDATPPPAPAGAGGGGSAGTEPPT
jgi:predicted PurR-regulated permease PerM